MRITKRSEKYGLKVDKVSFSMFGMVLYSLNIQPLQEPGLEMYMIEYSQTRSLNLKIFIDLKKSVSLIVWAGIGKGGRTSLCSM